MSNNEYLNYPREFRLLEELKESDGYVNIGSDDINLDKFTVNLLLNKSFNSVNFDMIIPKSYPNQKPEINLDKININNIEWNNTDTIKTYLTKIYNILNI
jgi:hypothetical protein